MHIKEGLRACKLSKKDDDHHQIRGGNSMSDSEIYVASCSLAELFSGREIRASCKTKITGRLHIPEYQRPYRWGDKQVLDLHHNIQAHFSDQERLKTQHDYYLGSIVLHQSKKDDETLLNIIDGQQRLTSMGILCHLLENKSKCPLEFDAPQSQQRIRDNVQMLKGKLSKDEKFNLGNINVTLVITNNEDDAYKFFETQNTGGVRLSGVDIVKAHHLRGTDEERQDDYAKKWEMMVNLASTVDCLMRGRYWQTLGWRDLETNWLPSEKHHGVIRELVVSEFAEGTATDKKDIGFSLVKKFHHTVSAKQCVMDGASYAMRQPLWAGVNSIHYLEQFHEMYQKWCPTDKPLENAPSYYTFYHDLVVKAESAYLRQLYNTALLMYLSKFGEVNILEFSLWLFRAVFSLRMSLDVVREKSIQKFAKESQLLDWIDRSYSHEQLMRYLQSFTYSFTEFEKKNSGVKKRFLDDVKNVVQLSLDSEGKVELQQFDSELQKAIQHIIIKNNNHEIAK